MEPRPTPATRILFAGDLWCHAATGFTALLEARLRLSDPAAAWRFWHQGEAEIGARNLFDEAAFRLLGRDAQKVLVSVGHAPADREALPESLDAVQRLLDLLSDKLPGQTWLLLPCPSLWPEASREACHRLRTALQAGHPALHRIDPEPEVAAFLALQHPDHAASLIQPGPTPTLAGSLLLSESVLKAWSPKP